MFTYDYWCSEVLTFKAIFESPGLQDEVYVGALNGLSILVGYTIETDPGHKAEVIQEFRECFALAKQAKGVAWMRDHAMVFATHGSNMPM